MDDSRPEGRYGLRVLLADDDPDSTDSLALLLNCWGHTVPWVAHDGATALALAEANEPDVILLDIGLPGLDGWAVVRRLRSSPHGRRSFVIALTGYGTADDYAQSEQVGVDRHLVKPIDPLALKELLAALPSTN